MAWITVESFRKPKEARKPHQWNVWKLIPWPYCRHCGLVWLKNDATFKSVKQGCLQEVD